MTTEPRSSAAIPLPTRTWGSPPGPQVLLVHGLTSSAATWAGIAEPLSSGGVQVTAVDLRGHGNASTPEPFESSAMPDDLLALPLPRTGSWDLVVGHSLGGALVVLAGSKQPTWARALLLLDPVLQLPDDREPLITEVKSDLQHLDARSLQAAQPRWQPSDVAAKIEAAQQLRPGTVDAILRQPGAWDHTGLVTRSAATVVAFGADPAVEEPSLTPREGELLQQAGVRYELIAGAGHSIHRDDPDRVLDQITRMLNPGAPVHP